MSEPTAKQSTLLGLPRELRDQIIGWATVPSTGGPTIQDLVTTRSQRRTIPKKVTGAWEESNSVLFPGERPVLLALRLLLTNHQLNAETREVMAKKSTRSKLHHDVVFMTDFTVWPTWSDLPLPPLDVIDELHSTWRIFKAPPSIALDMYRTRRGLFVPGDGAPPANVWIFFHLLIVTLAFGPAGYDDDRHASSPSSAKGLHVRKIILEFLPPTEECVKIPRRETPRVRPRGGLQLSNHHNDGNTANASSPGSDNVAEEEEPVEKPHEVLCRQLAAHLRGLAALGYHTLQYGKILYERVGEIELRAGGDSDLRIHVKLYPELHAKTPAGHEWGTFDRERRWGSWTVWRDCVLASRTEMGFPVGDPVKDEAEKVKEEKGEGRG